MNVMTVSHPFGPERYDGAREAWHKGLKEGGYDPANYRLKLHVRVWVDENRERAREMAEPAIDRYDKYSGFALGRPADPSKGYDWQGMLDQGRNVYGNPDDCIRYMENTRRNFDFDIFSATFYFGGLPYDEVRKSMRLFAKEVMPAFRDEPVTSR